MNVFQEMVVELILYTEPKYMILVIFFSEDNVLSDEIKICYIFAFQSNKNWEFHFFWDTQYMDKLSMDNEFLW